MPALDGMRVLDMTPVRGGHLVHAAARLAGRGRGQDRAAPRRSPAGAWSSPRGCPSTSSTTTATSAASPSTSPARRDAPSLLRMAPQFDVFVENYGPGVMEKLDLTYEVDEGGQPLDHLRAAQGVRADRPLLRLPLLRLGGAGVGGCLLRDGRGRWAAHEARPHDRRLGNGALSWRSPSPPPTSSGSARARGSSSRSRCRRRSPSSCARWGCGRGGRRRRNARATARGPGTDVYPCKPGGPNDYLFVMIVTTAQWDAFCMTLGQPELVSDPRFETQRGRFEHAAEFYDLVADWTRERTKHEAMVELGDAGVPCSATIGYVRALHRPAPERARHGGRSSSTPNSGR